MVGYFGGKEGAGVYQAIIAQFPPHDTYIETHLGGGSILRLKPPAARSIAIDRDARCTRQWRDRASVETHTGPCEDYLAAFNWTTAGRVLLYADPPYLLSTRTSAKRYQFDYTEADHVRLLTLLRSLPCSVALSGYPAALYDDMLRGWRKIEFQAMTRGGPRTECLWMNYAADKVQWSTFAGKNHTKRQHVKRKAERWAAKFRAMSPAERCAVLAALLAEAGAEPNTATLERDLEDYIANRDA